MAPIPSPKTEKGLEQLNELLGEKSYVTGSSRASAEDVNLFLQIRHVPDQSQYPHLLRWHQHISALRSRYPGGVLPWLAAAKADPAAKKGRAPGKEKQQLTVDCLVLPVEDRHHLAVAPPALGSASNNFQGKKLKQKYYITTAITYSNGWQHIGHAYEALTADAFSRYHRICGEDVFFMTGADEHGQKIAQAAEGEGLSPLRFCDRYCDGFQALNQRLLISNDFFVRTTADRHKDVARAMWEKCKSAGDIYLDHYEGWYLVREERFVTEQEAQEWNYKDPGSGVPLKKMSEPSFFFRLSKFQQPVINLIEDQENFIQPAHYRTEILERLRGMEVRDLSISRGTFEWGVPCPEDKVDGQPHVMYVWFDALINYISGVDGIDENKPHSRFWPADMHIVGKDIVWFHTVIWPAMLMSAGVPLPKSVVVHGFISGVDGRKMSKSYGNVVDPHDMLDHLSADTVRWYFCRESTYGDDVKFNTESLTLMHNAELCDNLGNLVNRAVNLCEGKVPEYKKGLVSLPFDLAELKAASTEAYAKYRLTEGAELAIRACAATNKWISEWAPWKMKGEDQQPLREATCRLLLEAVYTLAHFFTPFIPTAADAIFSKVGAPPRFISDLSDAFANLTTGNEVKSASMLFEQVEQPLFAKLDVRVGQVVKAYPHPDADRLFVMEIDVGDPKGKREVISALREHYTVEQLQGKKLLAICNITPAKVKGVASHGMILCAKQPDKNIVELLAVDESLPTGTRVLPEGLPFFWTPHSENSVDKCKVWSAVVPELHIAADRTACFAGKPLVTATGVKFLAPSCVSSIIT